MRLFQKMTNFINETIKTYSYGGIRYVAGVLTKYGLYLSDRNKRVNKPIGEQDITVGIRVVQTVGESSD